MSRILFILLLLICRVHPYLYSSSDFSIIENEAKIPVLANVFSEQQTLKIELNNGLQAYLVSNPQANKSAVAMTVKAGSWEDPQEYPGIAHFLEHMLFLGTKSYPDESEYDRFITEHGGLSNAFTTNDFTSYVFTINHQAFPEALDRFSSFFKDPLFNPAGVARELQAIDQEYAKNLENDDVREYYVHRELSNPSHPNHAFSMGNHDSLCKVSQDTLKEWYKQHYSANRMRLVVSSNQPLEKLQQLVVDKFKAIPNSNIPQKIVDTPMLPDSLKGHMVYIEPIKNIRQLTLIWELPQHFGVMQETKPDQLVCYILGNETKKSLLHQLKKEKLAESIQCGSERIGGNTLEFMISIELTDAGVKNVDTVILRTFEVLANLRNKGIPHYIFDEVKTMATIDYQYQSMGDEYDRILKEAIWIANENLSTYPEYTHIIQRFDRRAIEELLAFLTPQNCVFDLMAPKNLTGITFDKIEHWLSVPYTVKSISSEKLITWGHASPHRDIDLPEANPFIPEKLTLVAQQHANSKDFLVISHPISLVDNEKGKIYFASDDRYFVPQISWIFEIKTPSIHPTSPESIVLADLYVKSAMDVLNSNIYLASMAGIDFKMAHSDNGITISIQGYNEKAHILFLQILKDLKDWHPREHHFKGCKDVLLRQYQNAALESPLNQGIEILRSAMCKQFITNKDKSLAIKKINFEQFEEFSAAIFNFAYVEGMLYGNMTHKQAKKLANELITTLASKPYPKNSHYKKEVIVLSENQSPILIEAKTKARGNAALLSIQMDPYSFKARAAQQILMQAIKEPFFTTLRTKQQTGYIVLSRPEELELTLFDSFGVQSNTHDGRDLLARFELFIEEFVHGINKQEFSKEMFDNIKNALLNNLRQSPKNVAEMNATLSKIAFSYDGDFEWLSKRIKGFEDLTYEEFMQISTQTLGKQNKKRLSVLLTGSNDGDGIIQYKKLAGIAQLRKLSSYR